MKRIIKSAVFASSFVVLANLAAVIPGLPSLIPALHADDKGTLLLDVAIDCRTWRFNQGISFSAFGRGDSFYATGKIFRAGTLLPGTTANDPNAPGSIGTFIEHGTMAASPAEINAGTRPAFAASWLHLLDGGRGGIVAEGPHPDSGPLAVVGGMGPFSGASGELLVSIIGTNITGCPNMRLTFNLEK